MKTTPSVSHIWQLKLLRSLVDGHQRRTATEMTVDGDHTEPILSPELTHAIKQKAATIFDKWEVKITPYLRKYLGMPSSRDINTCEETVKRFLASFLVYYDIPKGGLRDVGGGELSVLCELGLSADAVSKIECLLRWLTSLTGGYVTRSRCHGDCVHDWCWGLTSQLGTGTVNNKNHVWFAKSIGQSLFSKKKLIFTQDL